MVKVGKILMEEYFPFLVLNGWSKTGIVVWIDYGNYFKVDLKDHNEEN